MLSIGSRRSFQRTDGVQGMGSILDKAWANRERDQDCFASVSWKRSKTGALERRAMRGTKRECEIDNVTKLAALERFVFVMSILERYSNWDCALLMGCSMNRVAQARMKALRRLPDLAPLFPRGNGLPMPRLGVTA